MSEQLIEAGMLLAIGMSVVFAFLTLLIGGIHGVAWVAKIFPDSTNDANGHHAKYSNNKGQQASHNNKNSAPTTLNPNLVAAITAAIHTHRREKK